MIFEVFTIDGVSRADVLSSAAAWETRRDHPLAAAILAAAPPTTTSAADVHAVAGHGLLGTVAGIPVRLGKPGSST